MAGTAVTFLSVTLAHVILRLRVASEIIGFLSVTDTYKQTICEMQRRISCLALRRSAIIEISIKSVYIPQVLGIHITAISFDLTLS